MKENLQERVYKLIDHQQKSWSIAQKNYDDLKLVKQQDIKIDKLTFKLQYNPARMISIAAKTDAKSIAKRPCFLCAANRPVEQVGISFQGSESSYSYEILINPFPIFEKHLTIVDVQHTEQLIMGRISDMMELAKYLTDFTIFFNGAQCGASAPDHFHFQACQKTVLPCNYDDLNDAELFTSIQLSEDTQLFLSTKEYQRTLMTFKSHDADEILLYFDKLIKFLERDISDTEPMLNILCSYTDGFYYLRIFPRAMQRPAEYYATGEEQMLVSPASVEMGGVFVLAREEDYNQLNIKHIQSIYNQVSKSFDADCLLNALR